jgi:hypothetical protein
VQTRDVARFVRTFKPHHVRVLLADGTEFDLRGAEDLLLDSGSLEIRYPHHASDETSNADAARAIFLSPSEWRRIVSTVPSREVQVAEGAARRRVEAIEKVKGQLQEARSRPDANPTVVEALTNILERLKSDT